MDMTNPQDYQTVPLTIYAGVPWLILFGVMVATGWFAFREGSTEKPEKKKVSDQGRCIKP